MNEVVKKIKFSNLTIINIGGRGIGSIFQAQVYNFLAKMGKKRVIELDTLVKLYIEHYGDSYIPKYISADGNSLIIGDPSKISWHYANETPDWKYILKPKIKDRFIRVFGQLVMNGMLTFQPKIKD